MYRAVTRHITPLPAQTSRPPEAVASSVYPAALSSFGRLCGTNTYEQNAQTPFRIDFKSSLLILHFSFFPLSNNSYLKRHDLFHKLPSLSQFRVVRQIKAHHNIHPRSGMLIRNRLVERLKFSNRNNEQPTLFANIH